MTRYCGLMLVSITFLLISLTLVSSECGSDGRVVLPIGLFASSDLLRTADAIPAAELAVQQINDDSDMLPGYCLQQKVFSSECAFDTAVQDAFTFFNLDSSTTHSPSACTSEGASIFIVGGGCPERTEGLTVVTPLLSSLEIDYTLSREDYHEAAFHIMPLLGYNLLATLNFLDAMGARQFTWLQEDVVEFTGYEYSHQVVDVPHWMNVSETVYLLESHAGTLRETACQAVKLGAVYPNKVWILYGLEGGAWWEWELDTLTECSNEEVKQFLDKAITIVPWFDGEVKGKQPTAETQFTETYNNLKDINRRFLNVHEPLIYDAVWLTAEALSMSLPILSEKNLTLNSSQRNNAVKEVVQSVIESNIYNGLTGSIQFEFYDGFRTAERFVVLQYQLSPSGELTLVPVANITLDAVLPNASIAFLEGYSLASLFPDGIPRPPSTLIHVVPWIAFGLIISFCVLGVVFAVVCIVMMVVLWNRREMKLTSPRLNMVIAIGAIVWYTSATVVTIPNSLLHVGTALCEIRRWGWNIGATLFFVPLLLKNWRVYYIFHNPAKQKKVLKDWKLLFVHVIFLIVDVILLTIFTSIPSTRLTSQLESLGPFELQLDCISNESNIAFGILAGYRTVLCIIGCVLAFQNRKVKIPELRESQQVGLATYAFLFTIVVEVAVVLAVTDSKIRAIVLSLEMQCAATFFLLIIFVPKIYRAIKGGSQSDTVENTESDLSMTMVSGLGTLQRYTLAALQSENEQLKMELKKYQKSAEATSSCNETAV